MTTKEPPAAAEIDQAMSDRRRFLGSLAAGAGAATLLAGFGASAPALAQQAGDQPPPAPGATLTVTFLALVPPGPVALSLIL